MGTVAVVICGVPASAWLPFKSERDDAHVRWEPPPPPVPHISMISEMVSLSASVAGR